MDRDALLTLDQLNAQLAPLHARLLRVRATNGVVRWARCAVPGHTEGNWEPVWETLAEAWADLRTLPGLQNASP